MPTTLHRLLPFPCVFSILLGLLLPAQTRAASPASGTVSQASPVVSWTGGPVTPSANTSRLLDVVGITRCGVSPLATAVVLNVTVTQPTSQGHLTVYAADLAQPPPTSTLNFVAGATLANNAIVELSNDGKINLRPFVVASGSVHLIVDVVGFFIESP